MKHFFLAGALAFMALVPTAAQADLLYSNTVETGSRANPGAGANDAAVRRIWFDDVPIVASALGGLSRVQIDSITVGVRRGQGAPATDVSIWASEITGTTLSSLNLNAPLLVGTTSLAERTDAGFVTELVTMNLNPGQMILNVNYDLLPGFGTIGIGMSLSNIDSLSGWRVNHNASIPGFGTASNATNQAGAPPNLNTFWSWDDSLAQPRQFFQFSGADPPAPPGAFYIVFNGTAVPEPTSLGLIGLGAIAVLAARRRRS